VRAEARERDTELGVVGFAVVVLVDEAARYLLEVRYRRPLYVGTVAVEHDLLGLLCC
jgi:hypothetical protein